MNNHQAIYATHSNIVSIRGDDAFDVNDNKVEINMDAVNAWANANAYKAKRSAEYPSIPDQLDLLFHGGIDAWKEVIQAVKTKYPKG